jgi:peptidoglycan/LPS O-acetylase OafA/YrhL
MIKLNYRPEIDGLRAIAVLAVIFYHVEFYFNDLKLFSGGFIGVDIFFVISGYLITSIIIKEIKQNNRFSLASFYMRRARRILPALFFTIFISIFFAWHFLIPSSFIQFSNSIISSIFFFSNYFFYFEGLVYNSDQSLLKPLLHTWSLSVEEQFYIFFPIILIFVNKFFKEKLLFVFFLLFFLSFIVAFYTSMNNLSFSFFSTLSRGWEFLAGSFLAYLEINK